MKLKILIGLCCCFSLVSEAQVSINIQLPPAGMIQKEELWNLILTNNLEPMDIVINFSLKDARTGEELFSGRSSNLLVGKGARLLFVRDVQPVQYNYSNQDFAGTYIPMGAYIACYQLFSQSLKEEKIAQECFQLNIDPLSPPLLNTPSDQSEIEDPFPHFTWLPPTPLNMFSSLSYDLVVAEVLQGQAAADAVQFNHPVYMRSGLRQANEFYTTSVSHLQENKQYAWQVVARNVNGYAVKTQVWTFTLRKPGSSLPAKDNVFILMDEKHSGIHHIKSGLLKIKFYSYAVGYTAQVKFIDGTGKSVVAVTRKIVPGNNYLEFDLTKKFERGRVYKLSLTDSQNKEHLLAFSIQ
jgi:hypothetical protein